MKFGYYSSLDTYIEYQSDEENELKLCYLKYIPYFKLFCPFYNIKLVKWDENILYQLIQPTDEFCISFLEFWTF